MCEFRDDEGDVDLSMVIPLPRRPLFLAFSPISDEYMLKKEWLDDDLLLAVLVPRDCCRSITGGVSGSGVCPCCN